MIELIKKRVPIIPYTLFSILVASAPFFLLNVEINYIHLFLSFFGMFILLVQMRILDDLQDAEIDKIAHKDRPFASGQISINDGERIVGLFQLFIFIFSVIVFLGGSYTAFFFYLTSAVYIWNNYKGFYFEEWMKNHPIAAFVLGELVFFPIIFFCFALADDTQAFGDLSISYAFLLFSALIIYDIARKLDPKAHPIVQNFVHLMGYRRVFFALMPILFVSSLITSSLGLSWILYPVQFAAFVALAGVLFSSLRWNFAASVTLISLFIHAASPLLLYLFKILK